MNHMVRLPQEVSEYIRLQSPNVSQVVLDSSASVPGSRHFLIPANEHNYMTPTSLDFSTVRILHHGLDTIRQLYEGVPNLELVERFEKIIADHEFHLPIYEDGTGEFPGQWVLRRLGKSSGYRYMLQNDILGVQIFYISRFQEFRKAFSDDVAGLSYDEPVYGSHIKLQTQSIFNNHHTDEQVKAFFEKVASYFFVSSNWRYKAVSVHMACDIQGWNPTIEFLDNVLTRSPKCRIDSGIETVDLDVHGVIHGRDFETVTLGNVRTTEFTVYDKLKKADTVGARNYWETIYKNNCPEYDNSKTVRRIEVRFSHNVILQMSDYLVKQVFDKMPSDFSISEEFVTRAVDEVGLVSYFQLKPYLNALWQTGLSSFRYLYDYSTNKKLLHPIWSILQQEVDWGGDHYVDLKRLYKKPNDKRDPEKTEVRNVKAALANMLSVVTRNFHNILSDMHNLIDNSPEGLPSFVGDFIDSLQGVGGDFFETVRNVFSRGVNGGYFWRSRLIEYISESIRRRVLCSGFR